MVLFPSAVFVLIIFAALFLTGAGAVTLGVLVVRDWRKGTLW